MLDEGSTVRRPMSRAGFHSPLLPMKDITKDKVEQSLSIVVRDVDDPRAVHLTGTLRFVGEIDRSTVPEFLHNVGGVWRFVVDEVAFGDTTVGADITLVIGRDVQSLQPSLNLENDV